MNEISLSQEVRFFGRTTRTEQGVFCNWSGSGFTFSFIGTSVWAVFESFGEIPDENRVYMGVFVDESPYESARFPVAVSGGIYTLAENLPAGRHTIRVVRETEIYYGFVALKCLRTDGSPAACPPPSALRLEFIGDSITCGYGNLSSNANPEFTTAEENFSDTFAFQTASLLKADYSVVAASGNGFAHHYGCETNNLIPELYRHTDKLFANARGTEPEAWDFSHDPRDAVVVKLGENDRQFCSGADLPAGERTAEVLTLRRKDFCRAAQAFLKEISAKRPGTPIVLIYNADMLLKPELCEAAASVPAVHTLEILPKREYEGVGANGHFSRFTHARVAALLEKTLRSIL